MATCGKSRTTQAGPSPTTGPSVSDICSCGPSVPATVPLAAVIERPPDCRFSTTGRRRISRSPQVRMDNPKVSICGASTPLFDPFRGYGLVRSRLANGGRCGAAGRSGQAMTSVHPRDPIEGCRVQLRNASRALELGNSAERFGVHRTTVTALLQRKGLGLGCPVYRKLDTSLANQRYTRGRVPLGIWV